MPGNVTVEGLECSPKGVVKVVTRLYLFQNDLSGSHVSGG